jgi:hypothetical protein
MMKEMRYLENDRMWLLPPPTDLEIEVLVAGDRSAPDADRIAVLDFAMPMIRTLCSRAEEYLDSFVDRAKFSSTNRWNFEGIEFGRAPESAIERFSMYFSTEGDLYGEWCVSFQFSSERFFPIAFQRRQL